MGEVLSIETVRAFPYRDLAYDQIEGAIRSVCDSHEELRARLERAEAALKEARGLIGELYDNGCWNDAQVTEIRATCALLDAALGAAGERSGTDG